MIETVNKSVFALVLAVVLIPLNASATGLTDITRSILGLNWSSIDIATVIDETSKLTGYRDVGAPLGDEWHCSQMRVLRVFETVIDGECNRCLRVEFLPSATSGRYDITALVFEYEIRERLAADDVLRELFKAAGLPGTSLNLSQRAGTSAEFTHTWTLTNEMRSLNVIVKRLKAAYQIQFDHRRWSVPGVSAVP